MAKLPSIQSRVLSKTDWTAKKEFVEFAKKVTPTPTSFFGSAIQMISRSRDKDYQMTEREWIETGGTRFRFRPKLWCAMANTFPEGLLYDYEMLRRKGDKIFE